jgi:hypothetical protein
MEKTVVGFYGPKPHKACPKLACQHQAVKSAWTVDLADPLFVLT